MANITRDEINFLNERYSGENIDELFASGLLTWPSMVSGPRQHLFSTQVSQAVMLNNPETPRVFTGYEKTFGKYVDSYMKSTTDYEIVDKIYRHSNFPNMIYLLVVKELGTNSYDVIKVSHYEKMSESHGYLRPFDYVDDKGIGSIVSKDEMVFRANTIDEHGNYRYGVNAKTVSMSLCENEEDATIVSRSFAEKTTFNLITKTECTWNLNDIGINLYGDFDNYQFVPNIGEYVDERGILFALRKISNKNIASDLTDQALMQLYYDDRMFKGKGMVVDIDIKVNDIEGLKTDQHREQLYKLYTDQFRYNQEVYNTLSKIVKNKSNKVSYKLEQELFNATNYINPNIKYSSNSGNFEFAYITIYTSYTTGLQRGFKMTNRCGSKGVIGDIWDDELMPVDEHGVRADVIMSAPSYVGRENFGGGGSELAINYASDSIVRMMKKLPTKEKQIALLIEYLGDINKEYQKHVREYIKLLTQEEKQEFINNIFKEGIFIYNPPFHNIIRFDSMKKLYRKYKIKRGYIRMMKEFDVDEKISSLYMNEEHVDKLKEIREKYVWTSDDKKSHDFSIFDLEEAEKVKNAPGLSLKDYKENTWVDNYLWGSKEKITPLTKSQNSFLDKILRFVNKVTNYDMLSKRSKKDFNLSQTNVFKKDDGTIVREFRSSRPVIIADMYFMIQKQIPDAYFSARYLGNTTPLGIPNKTFNKVETGRPYSDTCNRFSDMENRNLKRRCDPEIVSRFLAVTSTHPEYRSMLAENLLFNDPLKLHDLPIENKDIKDTVVARQLRAYLAAIGLCVLDDDEKDPFEFADDLDIKDFRRYFSKLKIE